MATIAETFGDMGIAITREHITAVEKMVVHFTLRGTHPLTLDGPYLGCDPIAFTTSDYNALFDIFDLHKKDIEVAIIKIPSIDRSFIVTSDPFNLLCFWLIHLAPIYIKDKIVCHAFSKNIARYFLYRVFCSTVNHSFRYGSSRGVMEATINALSRKSDIVRLESWKRLMDSHCDKILDSHDRFYPVLIEGGPDDAFLRTIAESQTALRAKIVTFAGAYYDAHTAGDSVGFKSSVSENAEGERIIAQTASVIGSATQAMVAEILNPNMFIHDTSVVDITNTSSTISPRMLKTALLRINETAVLQAAARTFDKVDIRKNEVTFIGVRALIIEIIRTTISVCGQKRVNMGKKALVFETMKDVYKSSRSLDPDIAAVKRSIAHLVDPFMITTNEAAKSALRLCVINYIVYRCLNKM